MDTWATSSLTPQIAGGWGRDEDLFARVFPMDLRPQAHEIIRTWLFYTVLKAELEHGSLPWTDAAISGFVMDRDRKKMSKSKGNVVTPLELLQEHGADAVRYWAGSARLGLDAIFKQEQIKIGRRLAIKILNASRFALGIEAEPGPITEPVDLSMLASLRGVVHEATAAFDDYEHAKVLDLVERFFWGFTDDYLELVKQRAYGVHGPEGAGSAVAALRTGLDVLLRLFAPFLPYVTEEVWSWWREGSIHRAAWPSTDELAFADGGDPEVFEVAAIVLGSVRKHKALAKVSLRVPAERVTVRDTAARLAKLDLAAADVREAGNVRIIETAEGEETAVETVLAAPEPA
jgi:valyl-tRNA synthetase